jgi:hypothetical protein
MPDVKPGTKRAACSHWNEFPTTGGWEWAPTHTLI